MKCFPGCMQSVGKSGFCEISTFLANTYHMYTFPGVDWLSSYITQGYSCFRIYGFKLQQVSFQCIPTSIWTANIWAAFTWKSISIQIGQHNISFTTLYFRVLADQALSSHDAVWAVGHGCNPSCLQCQYDVRTGLGNIKYYLSSKLA